MQLIQYKQLFLKESRSKLKELEDEILYLEKSPGDRPALERTLILFHGLKSDAATMSFLHFANAVHNVEDFLLTVREGRRALVPAVIDNIFMAIDAFRKNLNRIESGEGEMDLASAVAFTVRSAGVRHAAPAVPAAEGSKTPPGQYAPLGSYVDVTSEQLDATLALANDVIASGQQVQRLLQKKDSGGVRIGLYNLATKASALRESVVLMKMIPVKQYFVFLPRLVRDLAREQRKFIGFTFNDNSLRFERNVLESLREICVQLVKNAVDHGFKEGDRGTVTLTFNFKSGRINVQVVDSGRGIDWEILIKHARKLKLIRGAHEVSPEQRSATLFGHGVSSKKSASLVSGRGVGLPLVKQTVDRLGGTIGYVSRVSGKGHGTVFDVSIPLSPTLFRALTWHWGPYRLALPLFAVRNVIQLPEGSAKRNLKSGLQHGGRRLPLVNLSESLGLPDAAIQGLIPVAAAVVQANGKDGAVLLPSGFREEELIIQSLAPLTRFSAVSGVAVSEDSMPVIIINFRSLNV